MREVKILMLHGYTQSGSLFHAKTRALEKLLVKIFAPLKLAPRLIYPTAPIRLSPHDIPGWTSPADMPSPTDSADQSDAWAWFRRQIDPSDAKGQSFAQLDQGMQTIATAIMDAGSPVDGVIGFSQGGCMAAMLASLLERTSEGAQIRPEPKLDDPTPQRIEPGDSNTSDSWPALLRAANSGKPLRFAVIYSGFKAEPQVLQWLYEPLIVTPTLHFLGGLDSIVDETRSQQLIERCQNPIVLTHPGGHYVPVSREWAMHLAGFITKCVQDEQEEES